MPPQLLSLSTSEAPRFVIEQLLNGIALLKLHTRKSVELSREPRKLCISLVDEGLHLAHLALPKLPLVVDEISLSNSLQADNAKRKWLRWRRNAETRPSLLTLSFSCSIFAACCWRLSAAVEDEQICAEGGEIAHTCATRQLFRGPCR